MKQLFTFSLTVLVVGFFLTIGLDCTHEDQQGSSQAVTLEKVEQKTEDQDSSQAVTLEKVTQPKAEKIILTLSTEGDSDPFIFDGARTDILSFIYEGKYGFIDEIGQVDVQPQYDDLILHASGDILLIKDQKLGFWNPEKKVLVPCKCKIINSIYNGFAIITGFFDYAKGETPKYGVSYLDGNQFLPIEYDEIRRNKEGWVLKKDGRQGFMNTAGKLVLPIRYGSNYGNVTVRDGLIIADGFTFDLQGNELFPLNKYRSYSFDYHWNLRFSDGLAPVSFKDKYTFVTKSSHLLTNPIYDKVLPFSKDLACVYRDKKWTLLNYKGQELFPPRYEEIKRLVYPGSFVAFFTAKLEGKYTILDKNGKELFPPKYEAIGNIYAGSVIAARFDGKWGHISLTGQEMTPFQFDHIHPFKNDFAKVMVRKDAQDFFGVINRKKKLVIPFEYLHMWDFHDGVAIALNSERKWVILNTKGEVILDFQFNDILGSFEKTNFISVQKDRNGKWAILNRKFEYLRKV